MHTNLDTHIAVVEAAEHPNRHGYVVLERLLMHAVVERWRRVMDELFAQEPNSPYEPGDGSSRPEDDELKRVKTSPAFGSAGASPWPARNRAFRSKLQISFLAIFVSR